MDSPPEVRAHYLISVGQIGHFVDEMGNLTHQALYRVSGEPALDTAWLAAVRPRGAFSRPPKRTSAGFYPAIFEPEHSLMRRSANSRLVLSRVRGILHQFAAQQLRFG
jgi:hypothetical protein